MSMSSWGHMKWLWASMLKDVDFSDHSEPLPASVFASNGQCSWWSPNFMLPGSISWDLATHIGLGKVGLVTRYSSQVFGVWSFVSLSLPPNLSCFFGICSVMGRQPKLWHSGYAAYLERFENFSSLGMRIAACLSAVPTPTQDWNLWINLYGGFLGDPENQPSVI